MNVGRPATKPIGKIVTLICCTTLFVSYNAAWYAKVCKMNQVLKECLEKCPESTTKSNFAKFLENEEKKQICRKAKVLESLGEATLKCIVETCEDIDKESEGHCGTSGFIVRAREMARLQRESAIDQLTEKDLEVISQVCQYEYCYRSRVEILIKMHAECDAKPALLLLNANVQLLKGYAAELEKTGRNPERCSDMLSKGATTGQKEDTSTLNIQFSRVAQSFGPKCTTRFSITGFCTILVLWY